MLSSYASKQGKTTVTASLAYWFRAQGKRVRVFKVGPDYLDPKILEVASAQPVYQLDLWMVGEDCCRRLLAEAAASADIILVEGVMGLFDGVPSSADLAKRFSLPVVGIVNAGSMAQTVHAIAHGLAYYDPALNYVGTVANCVATQRHAQMIAEHAAAAPPYLGGLMRSASLTIPSRHLGLQDACELPDLETLLKAGAELVAATGLPTAAQPVNESFLEDKATFGAVGQPLAGLTIAVARDHAFSFLYQANLDFLERAGAALSYFSPLADSNLPACDALYLPGGYPELHLSELSLNQSMKESIRAHEASGKAIYAECGGMLYLLEELVDGSGQQAAMVGLLNGKAALGKKLTLGYQQFELYDGVIRGHTFHYSQAQVEAEVISRARHPYSDGADNSGEPMYRQGNLTASYVHLYFPSQPSAAVKFFLPVSLDRF